MINMGNYSNRYIWFDHDSSEAQKDLSTTLFLLLKNGYHCVVKDEGCGYVLYFTYANEDMGETLALLEEDQFVTNEDEFTERYLEGQSDMLDKVFQELKTMADDDLVQAMANALEYNLNQ